MSNRLICTIIIFQMIPFCVAIISRVISQVISWFNFVCPWYLQNVLKNSNIPFSVGCYFAWKPQCAPKILWMIDNYNKCLRNKTKDCESTFKNKEITALTFFAKKSNFYSKNWKLRISLTIKRFGEHFRLFSQINVQLAIIK